MKDAQIKVPNAWPQSPHVSEYSQLDNLNETLYFLNGLRISSTVFTAMMWAADTYGELTPSYSFTLLDATLVFNFTWVEPVFIIPSNDSLVIKLEYTNINGTCYETDDGNNGETSDVIQFSMYNLTGNGGIEIEVDGSNESLLIIVNSFDLENISPTLDYPPIPLPSQVIIDLIKELVNATIPYLNEWLADHPFEIPTDIAQFLPNPVVDLVHQTSMSFFFVAVLIISAVSAFVYFVLLFWFFFLLFFFLCFFGFCFLFVKYLFRL